MYSYDSSTETMLSGNKKSHPITQKQQNPGANIFYTIEGSRQQKLYKESWYKICIILKTLNSY